MTFNPMFHVKHCRQKFLEKKLDFLKFLARGRQCESEVSNLWVVSTTKRVNFQAWIEGSPFAEVLLAVFNEAGASGIVSSKLYATAAGSRYSRSSPHL